MGQTLRKNFRKLALNGALDLPFEGSQEHGQIHNDGDIGLVARGGHRHFSFKFASFGCAFHLRIVKVALNGVIDLAETLVIVEKVFDLSKGIRGIEW